MAAPTDFGSKDPLGLFKTTPKPKTGGGTVPDSYYASTRTSESGGSNTAQNPSSSALGAYQFLDSTWRGLMKSHPELGLTADGRTDPDQAERAMRAFTEDNAGVLRSAGIAVDNGSLYAAHFLGAGGASTALKAPDSTAMRSIVGGDVIAANPFLADMTVGDFKAWAARKGGAGGSGDTIVVDSSFKPSDPMGLYPQSNQRDATADLLEPGNIDLTKRPIVQNSDGSVSTVRSMSFEEDGAEILIPTVSPTGQVLSDEDAIALYHKTGQFLGKFGSVEAANAYAEQLHQQQAKYAADVADAKTKGLAQQLNAGSPGRYETIPSDQLEQWQTDWQSKNGSKDILGDTWRLLGMGQVGVEASMREMVNQIPVVGPGLVAAGDNIDKWIYGKPSEDRYADLYAKDAATLTPETRAARDKAWWNEDKATLGDAWMDPRAYFAGVVESLPGTVATMAPAMFLARGAFIGAMASGLPRNVAAATAARSALLSGAVLEGGMGGADTARGVRAAIEAIPRPQLLSSGAVQTLIAQGMTPDEAINAVTNDAATQAFLIGGVATGIFGGFGDKALARIVGEGIEGSIGKRIASGIARGMVAEGVLEEAPQSAAGQFAQNIALRDTVDPSQSLGEGVADAALGGAAVGAAMGGAFGGAGGAFSQADPANAIEQSSAVPSPVAAPVAPKKGPLQTSLEQGLSETQATSLDFASVEEVAPKSGSTVTIPPETDMPSMPAMYLGFPEPGKRVLVEDEALGPRFAATVDSYVHEDDGNGGKRLEAIVADDNGVVLQVPADKLHVARLTQTLLDDLERRENPPIERSKPKVDPAKAREVNGKTMVMPDTTLAELYDLGKDRWQQKRLAGASGLQMRELVSDAGNRIADQLGVPRKRIGEIADDYRYRVERASKALKGDLPGNMHGINADKLRAWKEERKRLDAEPDLLDQPEMDVAPAVPSDADLWEASTFPDDREQAAETLEAGRKWREQQEAKPTPVDVDAAAHVAATSPNNDLAQPTQAQKEAGNYQKGHVKIGGLDLSIENPAGSERSGVDKGGKAWSVTMKSHYGYIRGTVGKDKDHIDVFIKKATTELNDESPVFVVDQVVDGKFDEHKVMLGYSELPQAKRGYLANYAKGWNGLGSITETTLGDFKRWLEEGDPTRQFSERADAPVAPTDEAFYADKAFPDDRDEAPATLAAAREVGVDTKAPMEPKPENVRPVDLTSPWFPVPATTKDISAVKEFIPQSEAAARLAEWKAEAHRIGREEDHSKEGIISLFDASGRWSQPFADAGYTVLRFDTKHGDDIFYDSPDWVMEQMRAAGVEKIVGLLSATPCTTFASSGARWWESRHDVNDSAMVAKLFGPKAAQLFDSPVEANTWMVHATELYADLSKPLFHVMENPIGRLPRMSGMPKPLMIFNPNNFGDAYTKKTQLWGDFDTDLPTASVEPVEGSKMQNKLRGDNPEDKAARSLTPEGFSYAFFIAQYQRLSKELDYQPRVVPRLSKAPTKSAPAFEQGADESGLHFAIRQLLGNWTSGPVRTTGDGKDLQAGSTFVVDGIDAKGTVTLLKQGYGSAEALPLVLTFKELNDEVKAGLRFEPAPVAAATKVETPKPVKPERKKAAPATSKTALEAAMPPAEATVPASTDRFAKNKLFTADKVEAARARLRSKMNQLNSGIDPEVLIDGMTIAGAYIEAGVRDFGDYAKAMIGDFGDGVKPFLLSFWEGARNYPGLDTKGMTPVEASARQHAELNKVLPAEAAAALGQEIAKPKKRTPKAGTAGDRTLIQDFGVEHIDGWAGEGEETDFGIKGGVKDNFIKDAMGYLRAVADILQQEGFTPPDDTKGRPRKAVNKNESGVAASGDVSLNLWHPDSDARIYVHIAGSALRGTVPTTPSGISIMFRVGVGADRDVTRAMNQWAPVDLSAADFAGTLRAAVDRAVTWTKRDRSQEEKQRVIEELKAVIARPPLPGAETLDEPSELDQPSQGALEGAPADAVPPVAGRGDAEQGAEGRGGADLPRSGRARAERAAAGRGVPDGEGAVSVPTVGADVRAAEPDAPSAGGDEGRAARDAGRVIEDAATAAATPAQNRPADFTISDEDEIGAGGAKTKFRNNVAAIELLRVLDEEKRPATRAEQAVLAKWVGWGGLSAAFPREDGTVPKGWDREAAQLKALLTDEEYRAAASSTRNAHYTSSEVVKAIWSIAQRLGFKGGRVLEPSVGAGNFIGLMPAELRDGSQVTGVELDHITGGIAKNLYPGANIHAPVGFQDFAVPDGYFDLAIGNPPFGGEKLYDKERRHLNGMSIHNYFFAKAIDALRPGGILAMVVTNFFLDAPVSEPRRYIAQHADFIGAIRLPNDAFLKNAGTEVTTDIVLFRKRAEGEKPGDLTWKNTGTHVDKDGKNVVLSRYFLDHPDMMLGEFGAFGTMYRGESAALISRPGQDTAAELAKAIEKLPRDLMSGPGAPVSDPTEQLKPTRSVGDALVGSVFIDDAGKLMVRRGDQLGETRAEAVELPNAKALARVTGMVRLRDAFAALRRAQINDAATDAEISALRKDLNVIYDSFVAEHGPVNADANKRLFRDDPTWPQIAALEEKFDKGLSDAVAKRTGEKARAPSAQKAAIFTRRTQQPYRPPTEAKSAKDALAAVLAEFGRVDVVEMVRLYGHSAEDIIDELGPLVFQTPAGSYATADAYLSGNVKKKLAEAKEAAAKDPAFKRNVEALTDVLPADIEAVDIDVKAGSPWVPSRHIVDFMTHILGAEGGKATYNRYNAVWTIDPPRPTEAATAQWATGRASAGAVVEAALNDKTLSIYDRTSDGKAELNVEETNAAKDKVERVKAEWKKWLWTDDERRAELGRIYNDTFNTDVIRTYDGSHLGLPGKVGDDIISLRPHQKSFIWRGMQSSTVLADHTVGAGKTFAAIALAMEMRRVGLAKKPMFVVPNHLVGQWAADFVKLYPGAKVLATTKGDFEKENRKKLFARVATGDWDAVIVAHSSFGKVPVDPKFEQQFIEQQIRDLDQSASELRRTEGGKSRTVKQIEKARANMDAKLKKLLDSGNKDVGMTFEEMGVDGLFVDEAHEFKNLGFATKMTRVGGLGNTQGSQKAADLYMKSRSVLERTGGRNLVFLSGTPISNTMAELYTVQRYLDYGALTAMGVAHFDAWAKVFGEVVSDWELSPSGTYKLNSRFAKFVNMPELMQRYLSFADVITNDDIKRQLAALGKTLPLPKVKGGKPSVVVVPRSKDQAVYIGEPTGKDAAGNEEYPRTSLVYRAEHLPKKVEKGSDNMLKVMSDARKAALDMRLIDPSYSDAPGSKVHVAADNIVRLHKQWAGKRGTQLVFIDLSTPKGAQAREEARIRELMAKADEGDEAAQEALDAMSPDELLSLGSSFSVYDDLRQKLIDRGIPEAEIAFIHDANTEAQKEELFGKVRSGRVRVLFGSTPKMGAGTNVQNRLVALHHLDAPWRPSDLEQRDGRGIRQGNELYAEDPDGFEIEILRYATKNTLDARQWQTIEGKARFVAQLRKGDVKARVVEDIAGEAANAAEMKAAASGNPLILEEMDLRQKLRRLEGQSAEHDREQFRVRDTIRRLREEAKRIEARLPADVADAAAATAALENGLPTTIEGQEVEKAGQLGAAVIGAARRAENAGDTATLKLGQLGDFAVSIEPTPNYFAKAAYTVTLAGKSEHDIVIDDIAKAHDVGTGTAIMNTLRALVKEPKSRQDRLDQVTRELPALESQIRAWPDAAVLADTKARHAEVLNQLKPKQQAAAPAAVAPAGAEASIAEEPVISLTGKELGESKDLASLRRAAQRWYTDNLVGEAAKTTDGLTVLFNRAGAKEATAGVTNETLLQAIPAIRSIIEKGRVLRREKPTRATKADTSRETIGGRLIAIREARGLPQASLAAELGLSPQRYGTYERGRSLPPPEVLDKLFELTGATADYILFGRGRGLPADLLEALQGQKPDVRERIVIGAPVRVGDRLLNLAVTVLATDDGRFAYDLAPVPDSAAPSDAEPALQAEYRGDQTINLLEIPPGWGVVASDTDATALTDADRAELLSIVQKVSGLDDVTFKGRISLPNGAEGWGRADPSSAAGLYAPVEDVIWLAEDTATNRTAYHEAFHRLQGLFLTDRERQVLREELPRLRRMVRSNEFRRDQVAGMSPKEIEAEAFAIYASGDSEVKPHAALRAIWDRIAELIRRVKSYLTGRGFDTSESIFRRAASGEIAQREPRTASIATAEYSVNPSVAREKAITELKGSLTDLQPKVLAAIPLTYFEELARPNMSAVHSYMRTKRDMDAYRGKKHAAADEIAQEWLKLTRTGKGFLPSAAGKAMAARLSDLMHQATLAGVDPTSTDEQVMLDPRYPALREQFLRLPPTARRLFTTVRDAYVDQANELDKLLLDAVRKAQEIAVKRADERYQTDLEALDRKLATGRMDPVKHREEVADLNARYANDKIRSTYANKARLSKLRASFEKNRVPAPYFPLARFGRYTVTLRDVDGSALSFSRREKAADRDRLAAEMREAYPGRTVEVGVMDEAGAGMRQAMDPRLVAEIEGILGSANVDGSVMDQIWQRYIQTMPDLSTRKRFIHRKGTAGFDADALRSFSSHFFHAAHQMGRLKYGADLQELLDQTAIQARKADDPTKGGTLANELARRHKWILNPQGSGAVQAVTSFMFAWYLGATPAAALVNLTQTPMLGIPIIGARFGLASTAAAMTKASADFVAGRGSLERSGISDEDKRALEQFYETGLIDRTQSHDLAGVGDTGVNYSPLRARVMAVISWAFHKAEVANREITAITAFRLARAAGEDFAAAVDTAHDLTWKTHFDYSNSSRPRLLQGDAAKLLLVFQNYQLNMWYRLLRDLHQSFKGESPQARKEARVQLAGIMGMMTLMGGVTGFFGFNVLMAIAGIFAGAFGDDDPFEMEQQMRTAVVDMFGRDIGGMILNGVPGHLLGIDLTSRIGMPDLFVRSPDDPNAEGRDWWTQLLVNAMGVVPSTIINMGDGISLMQKGNLVRGAEMMMPKALKDLMQAYRFANEGLTTRKGDEIMPSDQITAWDTMMKVVGFTPAKVAETYDRSSALYNADEKIRDKRTVLLNQFATAIAMDDDATIAQVLERIEAFNAVPIHRGYVITKDTIRRSLKTRASNASKREDGVLIQSAAGGADLRDLLGDRVY